MNSNKNLSQERKKPINEVAITKSRSNTDYYKQEQIFNIPNPKNDLEINEDNSGDDRGKKPIKQVKFKNIPEKIQIKDNYSDEYEEQEPYELTKPKNEFSFDLNDNEEEKNFEPVRPKV